MPKAKKKLKNYVNLIKRHTFFMEILFLIIETIKTNMMLVKLLICAGATIGSIFIIEKSENIKATFVSVKQSEAIAIKTPDAEIERGILVKMDDLKRYCKKNKMDTTLGIMINMHLPSNGYRAFVVSFKTKRIILKGLVAHGSGSGSYAIPTSFSNVANSLASSLGKYKIGERYFGKFGLAYKLHGQEATNSNAYVRAVVLHAHDCVPSEAVDYPICLSWGCPTVAPSFMQSIDEQIIGKKKPVALWIYY